MFCYPHYNYRCYKMLTQLTHIYIGSNKSFLDGSEIIADYLESLYDDKFVLFDLLSNYEDKITPVISPEELRPVEEIFVELGDDIREIHNKYKPLEKKLDDIDELYINRISGKSSDDDIYFNEMVRQMRIIFGNRVNLSRDGELLYVGLPSNIRGRSHEMTMTIQYDVGSDSYSVNFMAVNSNIKSDYFGYVYYAPSENRWYTDIYVDEIEKLAMDFAKDVKSGNIEGQKVRGM